MNNLYIIKDRLSEALKARDMTPQQLADRSGLYFTSVYRYLKGERIPKTDSIEKMAAVLNVSPSWLLGYDVPIEPDYTVKLDEDNLVVLIDKLSPDDKATLKTFVEALIKKSEDARKKNEEADNDKPEI